MAEGSALSFFGKLRALNLPTADYAIFGSGPLAVRGLIEEMHDLDVVARGTAWEQVKGLGANLATAGATHIRHADGRK
jgi:hypothetical protein